MSDRVELIFPGRQRQLVLEIAGGDGLEAGEDPAAARGFSASVTVCATPALMRTLMIRLSCNATTAAGV